MNPRQPDWGPIAFAVIALMALLVIGLVANGPHV